MLKFNSMQKNKIFLSAPVLFKNMLFNAANYHNYSKIDVF